MVEGAGLGERAREPVEKETPAHLDALLDHGNHEVVRHQPAGRHVFRGLPAQLGVARPVFAQEVSGCDVRQLELIAQPCRLGSLPDTGRPDQHEAHVGYGGGYAHRHSRESLRLK
jgi:hypothetical protein